MSQFRDSTKSRVSLPTTVHALRETMSRDTLLETVSLLLDNINDGVVLINPNGHVIYQNANAEKLLGHGPVITSPDHWAEIFGVYHLDGRTLYQPDEFPLAKALKGIETPAYEMLIRPDSGQPGRLIRGRAKPLTEANGQLVGAMACFHDATEHDELLRRTRYRSLHDRVTGVQNGLSIRDTIDAMIHEVRETNLGGFGVLLINLDRFGVVNNVVGRDAADSVLRRVGRLLQHRESVAAVGRLCADEFVVVVSADGLESAQREASALVDALRKLDLTTWRYNTHLTASVGATWIGPGVNCSTEEALAALTTAVDDAKADGRNRSIPVDLADAQESPAKACRVADVLNILNTDQLCLFAEPILQPSGDFLGYEVLTRVCGGDGAPSLPPQFLPTAERFGLIGQLDIRNLARLTQWMRSRRSSGSEIKRMHINLSGYTLANEACLQDWLNVMLANVSYAHHITVEVTETFAMKNPVEASAALHQIRQLGCQVALDDFGSGYCSFSRLKQLPLDYLKVDGSLVRNFLEDNQDRAILQSIIQLGRALKLPLIAEHAHNKILVKALFDLGIDYVQGHGVSQGQLLTACAPVTP